ncbi:MAG: lysylphosphatidylglycerol synthase transmembrane domain-containing protein, partial [Anaerolineae bacterium]|nr:lysylphosphatidylglycerol synthase transmembrane domain-containing protein [Anaerolineae bacterium]
LFALYVALRGVNMTSVGEALGQVNPGWLALTFLLITGTLVIRALRWRVLLGKQLGFKDAFGLINIGYLISGVLPLRAGDPARAVGASLRGPVTAWAALATVVVERVLDLFIMFILLLSTLPFVPGLRNYLTSNETSTFLNYQLILVLSGALALAMLVVFVMMALVPERVEKLFRWFLVKLRLKNPDKWIKPLHNILQGFNALSSIRDSVEVLMWSLVLWLVTALYFTTAMRACQVFIPETSLLRGTVAMWASAFGMVFPATGGLGSFHFAVKEALNWGFNVPGDMGFAYAVVVHAIPYISGIVLGAVTLLMWGLSLRTLVQMSKSKDDTRADE